jgi:hypothetical protein
MNGSYFKLHGFFEDLDMHLGFPAPSGPRLLWNGPAGKRHPAPEPGIELLLSREKSSAEIHEIR